ncbi:hypothetical protein C0431_13165 [bacterium]|nr:hypothetical protein [bacterium]
MSQNNLPAPQNMPPGHVNPRRLPRIGAQNAIAGAGAAWDVYSRMKEGEHIIPAAGKAALTGAFYAALPGGALGAIAMGVGLGVAQSAGAMYDGYQGMKQEFARNGQVMGAAPYMEEEGQVAMREMMLTSQSQAGEYMMQKTRNHARSRHSTY